MHFCSVVLGRMTFCKLISYTQQKISVTYLILLRNTWTCLLLFLFCCYILHWPGLGLGLGLDTGLHSAVTKCSVYACSWRHHCCVIATKSCSPSTAGPVKSLLTIMVFTTTNTSHVNKTFLWPTKTKTNGSNLSKQRQLVDLTFKKVNATIDLHSSDVPSTE